jgi:alpha-amylase/alpha-mannosidase (GH57 family)
MESILDGTWASGPWPEEMVVADVLLETGWTWQAWCATPAYIQRVVVDFIQARRVAERNEADDRQRQNEAAMRHGR